MGCAICAMCVVIMRVGWCGVQKGEVGGWWRMGWEAEGGGHVQVRRHSPSWMQTTMGRCEGAWGMARMGDEGRGMGGAVSGVCR